MKLWITAETWRLNLSSCATWRNQLQRMVQIDRRCTWANFRLTFKWPWLFSNSSQIFIQHTLVSSFMKVQREIITTDVKRNRLNVLWPLLWPWRTFYSAVIATAIQSVGLSVCLSVTRWYPIQTNENRIMRSSLWGSKNTLVFWYSPMRSRFVRLGKFAMKLPVRQLYCHLHPQIHSLQRGHIACNAERCISHGNSVCQSVCLTDAGTLSRLMKIGSRGLHC